MARILGGIIGLAVALALFLILAAAVGLGIGGPFASLVATLGLSLGAWAALVGLAVFLITLFAYVLAAIALLPVQALPAAAPPLPTSVTERFMSGVLTGATAGVNLLVWALLPIGPVGFVVGSVVATVCLLSLVAPIARSGAYQAVLGWMNWIFPYSWLATAVGVLLFVINLPLALAALGPGALRLDVLTGTIETTGGIVGITGFVGGFNLGNFTFLSPGPGGGLGIQTPFGTPGLSAHETGHTLTVAGFGGVFHWVNAVDENVPPLRRLARAYGELLSESHIPRPLPSRHVRQWS